MKKLTGQLTRINNEFSTDCVSCHMVNAERTVSYRTQLSDNSKRWNQTDTDEQKRKKLSEFSASLFLDDSAEVAGLSGVTAVTLPVYRKRLTNRRYVKRPDSQGPV